jgi:hypothetical protein
MAFFTYIRFSSGLSLLYDEYIQEDSFDLWMHRRTDRGKAGAFNHPIQFCVKGV